MRVVSAYSSSVQKGELLVRMRSARALNDADVAREIYMSATTVHISPTRDSTPDSSNGLQGCGDSWDPEKLLGTNNADVELEGDRDGTECSSRSENFCSGNFLKGSEDEARTRKHSVHNRSKISPLAKVCGYLYSGYWYMVCLRAH